MRLNRIKPKGFTSLKKFRSVDVNSVRAQPKITGFGLSATDNDAPCFQVFNRGANTVRFIVGNWLALNSIIDAFGTEICLEYPQSRGT